MAEPPIEELQNFCVEVVEKNVVQNFSPVECKSFRILPLFKTSDDRIAVVSPLKQVELEEVGKILNKKFVLAKKVSKQMLDDLVDFLFAKLGILNAEFEPLAQTTQQLDISNTKEGQLLKRLLEYQITNNISDLIFLPQDSGVEVLVKQPDGYVSRSSELLPNEAYQKILNILKILGKLEFASNAPCLESSFKIRILGREYTFRLSVVNTVHGKATSIRLLSKNIIYSLNQLIFFPSELDLLMDFARFPSKIKFIAGPMGSGKTTLMYSLLQELSKKYFVILIEDPPEAELPNIAQIPASKDFNYAQALKSVLRHNPDYIGLGELRDAETLKVAIQASNIGHGIFTTIHAGNPQSLINRVNSLGVPFSLLEPNLDGAVFPKLLPVLCKKCKELDLVASQSFGFEIYKSTGCEKCSFMRVSGKILVTELYYWNGNFELKGLSFKEQWERLAKKGIVGVFQEL